MHSNVPLGKWRPENRSNSSGPHLWGSCSILRSSPEASAFLVQWPLRGKQPVEEFVTELFLFSRDQVCMLVSWHLIPVSDCRSSKLLPAGLRENKGTADFLLCRCTEKLPLLPGPGLFTDTPTDTPTPMPCCIGLKTVVWQVLKRQLAFHSQKARGGPQPS